MRVDDEPKSSQVSNGIRSTEEASRRQQHEQKKSLFPLAKGKEKKRNTKVFLWQMSKVLSQLYPILGRTTL